MKTKLILRRPVEKEFRSKKRLDTLMLGEQGAKEKLEKLRSMVKSYGKLPTNDTNIVIGTSKDVNIDRIDNVPIMDDVMNEREPSRNH